MRSLSDHLFARPSFLEGVARLMDWRGTLNVYNESRDENEADANALRMDMAAVSSDFWRAIELYEQELAAGDES